MTACEQAIIEAGIHTVEMVATLAGEPLFASFEDAVVERYNNVLAGGLQSASRADVKKHEGVERNRPYRHLPPGFLVTRLSKTMQQFPFLKKLFVNNRSDTDI